MEELTIKSSFAPIADQSARILILGTLPSVQSLEKHENYGNPQNHFWRLVYTLFEKTPDALWKDKKEFLHTHRIALWDSIRSATNPGSLDNTLKNITPNDFDWFFASYPKIGHVFFNGAKSEEVFKKYYPAYYNTFPHTR
ncbi:MAG: DNA-deoxyinosine glycosylase, partial [Eubacteriales bacterium]